MSPLGFYTDALPPQHTVWRLEESNLPDCVRSFSCAVDDGRSRHQESPFDSNRMSPFYSSLHTRDRSIVEPPLRELNGEQSISVLVAGIRAFLK